MSDDEKSKPLAEVLSILDGYGLSVSEDGLRRLRQAGIVDAKGPLVTLGQAMRLKQVLMIRNRLGTKWTMDQLAFFMAMHDMESVPAKLVGKHVEFLVDDYTRITERILSRLGSGTVAKKQNRRLSDERAMAAIVVRGMYRNMALPATPLFAATRSSLETWVAVVLAVVFCRKRLSEVPDLVRRAVFLSIDDPKVAEERLEGVRSLLEQTLPSLRIGETNAMLQEVKRGRKAPLVMLRAARDTAHFVRLLESVFAPIETPEPAAASKTNVETFTRLHRSFLGLLAGLSIQMQANPRSGGVLARLRAGDDFGLGAYLLTLYSDSIAELERAKAVNQ